jgi:hypothetical protein
MRQSLGVDATWQSMAPSLVLFGIGMGLTMAQISNLTLSAVSVQLAGEASGVNGTMRQVGSSFGAAIIGAVLLSAVTVNIGNGIRASSVLPEQLKPVLTQITQSPEAASAIEFGGAQGLNQIVSAVIPGQLPPQVDAEIIALSKQALVESAKTAMDYTIVFAGLGFISAFFLINRRADGHGSDAPAAGH